FLINGRRVDIPSYQVKAGDVITVKSASRDVEVIKSLREGASRPLPKWVDLNADALEGRVVALPQRDDIDMSFSEHLVVEYYSKL
ncbi:MAG: S4 domain-containing protein, partial [Eubacteriales bacterium]|nr:S4 domain-containing protein [Eubacteriales bacterium]